MPRVRELTIAYRPHPSGAMIDARSLTSPQTVAAILFPILEHEAQEVFILLLLNTKRKLIAVHEIARGGIDSCHLDPRVIFRAALLVNAPGIILAHNHPSGDPSPSQEDLDLTTRLVAAGKLLEIEILDHLIVGDGRYCSFKETGRIF